jgi:hypothetical protein
MSTTLGEIIMAEERNTHVKMAMAEVFGLYMIAFVGIVVGCYGLKVFDGLGVIAAISLYLGIGLLVCTVVAFWNENLLLTGIFGVLAVFLLSFQPMVVGALAMGSMSAFGGDTTSGMVYIVFTGVLLLIMALVSWAQPVKMLPLLLVIGGLAFIFLGLWFGDFGTSRMENYRMIVGALWLLTGIVAMYMAAAITMLVMKGKPVLPLMISK